MENKHWMDYGDRMEKVAEFDHATAWYKDSEGNEVAADNGIEFSNYYGDNYRSIVLSFNFYDFEFLEDYLQLHRALKTLHCYLLSSGYTYEKSEQAWAPYPNDIEPEEGDKVEMQAEILECIKEVEGVEILEIQRIAWEM